MIRTLLVLFVSLSTASVASAQDETDDQGRKIQYKQKTEIDFEGVDVSGELIKPSGALLMDVKRTQFNPLIRFRENFDKEMKASLDEVK